MTIEDKFEKMAEYILKVHGERNKSRSFELTQRALSEFRSSLKSEISEFKRLSHDEWVNRSIMERKADKDMEYIQNVIREEERKRAINCFKIYK